MIDQSLLRVGDTIGHPSWEPSQYTCTRVEERRFYIDLNGQEMGFPFYKEFFVAQKILRKKSGFSQFIRKVEGG